MIEKYDTLGFLGKVHEYLDNALSEEECMVFIRDVHKHPHLIQQLNHERNIRTLIKNRFERKTVAQEFIERLRGQIDDVL